jgi:hypothetical protein
VRVNICSARFGRRHHTDSDIAQQLPFVAFLSFDTDQIEFQNVPRACVNSVHAE